MESELPIGFDYTMACESMRIAHNVIEYAFNKFNANYYLKAIDSMINDYSYSDSFNFLNHFLRLPYLIPSAVPIIYNEVSKEPVLS